MTSPSAEQTGRNEELPKIAEQVFQSMKAKVEKKGLKLSLTADGKEDKSKVLVSCKFLEGSVKKYSEEEGVSLADSLKTLGVDLST